MFVASTEYEEGAPSYEEVVTSIAQEDGELLVAVAFWGRGAECIVHPRPNGPVKMICNLKSGATNPATIEALHDSEGVVLKQHDRLHAKVVIGSKTAIVGSANFSSNGLNLEGEESEGWEEAGLATNRPVDVDQIRNWFRIMWDNAREVYDQDIEEAKTKWKERRASRILMNSNSSCSFALDSLTRAELSDRRIFVVISRVGLSEEAKSAYRESEEELAGQHVAVSRGLPPIYEGWSTLPKNAQLIDIYYGPRGAVQCHGVYVRTHELKFEYQNGSKGHLAVCRKETQIIGHRFERNEASQFKDKLKPYIEEIWNSQFAIGDECGKYTHLVNIVDICG